MALPTDKLKKGQTSTASDGDVYEWLGGLWRNTRNKRIAKKEIQGELTAANVPKEPKSSVESLSDITNFFDKKENVDKKTNNELSNVVKNTKTTNKLLKEMIGFFKTQSDKADDPTSAGMSVETAEGSSNTSETTSKPKKSKGIFGFVLAGLIKSLSFVFKKMPIFLMKTLPRLMIKGISSMFNAVFKALPRFIMRTLLPAIGKGLLKLFVGAGGILAMIVGFAEEIFSGGSLGDAFGAAIGQLVELFTGGFIQKEEVKDFLRDLGSKIGEWVFNAVETIKNTDFNKLFTESLESIKTTIAGFGTWIYDKAKTAYDLFLNWFQDKFPSTSAAISKLFEDIGSFGTWIHDKVTTSWQTVKDWFSNTYFAIGGTINQIFENFGTFGTWIKGEVKTAWDSVLKWIGDNVFKPIDDLSNIFVDENGMSLYDKFFGFLKTITDLPNMMMKKAMATAASVADAIIPDMFKTEGIKKFIAENKNIETENVSRKTINTSGMEGQTIDAKPRKTINTSGMEGQTIDAKPITGLIDTASEKEYLAGSILEKIQANPKELMRLQRAIRTNKTNQIRVNQFVDSDSAGKQKIFEVLPQLKSKLQEMPRLNKNLAAEAASNLSVNRQGDVISITNNTTVAQPSTDAVTGS